jgi:protein phosphatase
MSLYLRFAARSDVGLLREGNEDSVYAGPRVLAVADGMGGHAAGEVASAVAIAALAPLDDDDPGSDLLDALRESATSANEHLRDMVSGDPGLDGMGTTLTAMLFAGKRLGLVHVGDSRCYLLRDGELSQITADHTLVAELVKQGGSARTRRAATRSGR